MPKTTTTSAARIRDEWTLAAAGWRKWEANIAAFLWPVSLQILDAAGVREGDHVLDVGCGIGDPALMLAARVGPKGSVVGVDPVKPMILAARERAAALGMSQARFSLGTCRTVRAIRRKFDAVTGRFSFIFDDDPVAAFAHARTLLRPGGKISVAAWTPLARNPGAAAFTRALRRFAKIPKIDSTAPGKFQMSQPGQLAAALRRAGFANVSVREVQLYQFARDGDEFWRMSTEMGSALGMAVERLKPAQRTAMRKEVLAFAKRYEHDGVIRIPAVAQVANANA